ncbi:MAG: RNA 2',3'-cyclic phosphodiesterase [Candidatus Accumulibacter sp.]|uniref:RNA 2',3'-cyclic phosphodiesterase n=1 Tax=Candidatus Accumulibacter affinis TaxID=2954384 RepID=A0A935W5G3_9PROT|nr:RNA 2',3'-cyclic phosphodiesterase [Candidatus Accumulibacter affinis]
MTLTKRLPHSPASAGGDLAAGCALAAASPARLFLALWPTPDASAQLIQYLEQWAWPKGSSPVRADRLHLTLHFIGGVDRQRVATIGAGLQVPLRPFEVQLTQAAIWPRGLAVLQTTAPPEPLTQLHAELAAALRALGLAVEARPFRPHLTLARRAAGATPPAAAPTLCWRVDHYVLVESLLGAGGGYQIRRRYG